MRILAVCIAALFLFQGCRQNRRQEEKQIDPAQLQEQLIQFNRQKMLAEDSLITSLAESVAIPYQRSSTGMRYQVLPTGGYDSIRTGNGVLINYTIHLVDSTLCYSNADAPPFYMQVEQSDAASGFHEIVQRMCYGDSATCIWPSRLGYGLTGDAARIPQDAILLVDLKTMRP